MDIGARQGNGMENVVVLARRHVDDIKIKYDYLMYNDHDVEYELEFYGLGVLIEIEIS